MIFLLVIFMSCLVVDCYWYFGWMLVLFIGVMNVAVLDSRFFLVSVIILGGCLVYGMKEVRILMRLESGLVIVKGIYLKEVIE